MRTRVPNVFVPRPLRATAALVTLTLALVSAWIVPESATANQQQASAARHRRLSHRSDRGRREAIIACHNGHQRLPRRVRSVRAADCGATVSTRHSSRGKGWEGFGGGVLPAAGWRPYSSASPFNTSTEGATVDPNSQALVKAALSWGLPGNLTAGNAETTNDWGHPTFFAQPSDPVFTLRASSTDSSINGMKIPIPVDARPAGGGDGHMTVVTPDGWEYDFWQVHEKNLSTGVLTFSNGGRTRIDGTGVGGGGTAAEFGNLAGVIRAPELAAGHINHALFIVLKCAAQGTGFGYGTTATSYGSSYVYPAMHGGSSCGSEESAPPLGARFMLAMSDAQIQALAVPAWKKTILTALAHYGGYVGDTGGPGFAFMFESSTTYTALGQPDPLAAFAASNNLPTWEGEYVFNMANGVEWAKYLRVLTPPPS